MPPTITPAPLVLDTAALDPAARLNLAALRASPRDRERVQAWIRAGFNAARAARESPALGSEGTLRRTVRSYGPALCAILRHGLAG